MLNEPKWIRVEVLIAEQKQIIAEHGGLEGIRDMNLLESSCASPKQLYHYSNPKPSIQALSARYAYSLTRNHPFRDGNKRMALQSCELFLMLNGLSLEATDGEKYLTFLDLSAGRIDEGILISWITNFAR